MLAESPARFDHAQEIKQLLGEAEAVIQALLGRGPDGDDLRELLGKYVEIGETYCAVNEFSKGEKILLSTIQRAKESHFPTAVVLKFVMKLGAVYGKRESYDKGISLYREALQLQDLSPVDSLTLASSLYVQLADFTCS